MPDKIPTQIKNPNGLHQRYHVDKIVISKTGAPYLQEPDKDAEYFVMRLDTGGKDINHIKACRIGIHAYAEGNRTFYS